jgi:drug/metabolite transporter (DMT)-like permease
MNLPWWGYVLLAGLSWGTYVPIIFYGGSELGGKANARLMAILCVGIAYFLIGVLFPLALFLSGQQPWPSPLKSTGLLFASLAGVAGAVGAICVVFASSAAMQAGLAQKAVNPDFNPATYRLLIAPMIFGLAPVINTLVSSVWHPKPGEPLHFGLDFPGWKLWLGILLVAIGVALVLYSKEEAEEKKKAAPAVSVAATPAAVSSTTPTDRE